VLEQALTRHLPSEEDAEENEVSHGYHFFTNYPFITLLFSPSIPAATPAMAWVSDLSLAGIASSNPAGVTDVCLL
jgi:hypothetical protein